MIIRFYGENVDGLIKPLPNQMVENILPELSLVAPTDASFFEIKIPLGETTPIKISPLETDYIRPEALSAVKDNNETIFFSFKSERKEFDHVGTKKICHSIVERFLKLDEEQSENFKNELEVLLQKYYVEEAKIFA